MSISTLAPPTPPLPEHYEIIDGQVVEVPFMGAFESVLANRIAKLLDGWVIPKIAGLVIVEVMFQLDEVGDLIRRPDVAFVSSARWP